MKKSGSQKSEAPWLSDKLVRMGRARQTDRESESFPECARHCAYPPGSGFSGMPFGMTLSVFVHIQGMPVNSPQRSMTLGDNHDL